MICFQQKNSYVEYFSRLYFEDIFMRKVLLLLTVLFSSISFAQEIQKQIIKIKLKEK